MTFTSSFLRSQQRFQPVIRKWFNPRQLSKAFQGLPESVNYRLVEKLLNSLFMSQLCNGAFDFLEKREIQIVLIDANVFIGLSYKNKAITCYHFKCIPIEADITLSMNVAGPPSNN